MSAGPGLPSALAGPVSAVAAVVHPDPYPYYASLVSERPVHRDEVLGSWVVASAAAVSEVLASDRCTARPAAERVPRGLAGSPAGAIFGRFARMSDGAEHAARRQEAVRLLASFDKAIVAAAMRADVLVGAHSVDDFVFEMPAQVIGQLLGLRQEDLPEAAAATRAYVASFSPAADAGGIARGQAGAAWLLEKVTAAGSGHSPGVIDDAAANAVGLFVQSCEATAALTAATLLALATREDLREQARDERHVLYDIVREVARHDAAVQNTRRWVARGGPVAGHEMREGDAILVVLAAANRDPAANVDPDRLDPERADRRSFTFGDARHACPGESLAVTIAVAGIAELLHHGRTPALPAGGVTYLPSVNIRHPRFGGA